MYAKRYERVKNTLTGEVQNQHFVFADGKLIALNTQTQDAYNKLKDKQVRYLHYDALNSVDMITDGYGLIVERRSYDTWGKQRKVIWKDNDPLAVVQEAITNRGYTGHEEISEIGLIHMNGRVYDQELARFISPDPHIQSPFLTNSFNRYAYAMNNPLKYTDPTGFIWGENAGTCNVDGTTRDSNGKETGRWDKTNNGNDNNDYKIVHASDPIYNENTRMWNATVTITIDLRERKSLINENDKKNQNDKFDAIGTTSFAIGGISSAIENDIKHKTSDRLKNIFKYSGSTANKLSKNVRLATRIGGVASLASIGNSLSSTINTFEAKDSLSTMDQFDAYADSAIDTAVTVAPFIIPGYGYSMLAFSIAYGVADMYYDGNLFRATRQSL